MLTKTIDTDEYVFVLKELVEQEKEVSVCIAGNSMFPFLVHQRDMISFKKPKQPLCRGDMVFYQRESGQYVMHRIYKICSEGYYLIGDAQSTIEGPLSEKQIFAVVTKVQRNGKWIGPEKLLWKFFAYIWIRIVPVRRMILKGYSVFIRKGR